MRLLCPNCGAQYEVPDDVIPQSGRDVQCSNCGDTWFQNHADFESESEENFGDQDENSAQIDDGADAQAALRDTQDDTSFVDAEDEDSGSLGDGMRPQALDPAVADVLREEARIEAAARAGEISSHTDTGGLEGQQDLGLQDPSDESARRAHEARVRMARMRGEPEPERGAMAGRVGAQEMEGSRRGLLPDIEEINSTLRSTNDRRSAGDIEDPASPASVPQVRRRRGFRRGLLMMLVLAILAMGVYKYADQIGKTVPSIEPAVSVYVEKVNVARIWLDGQATALKTWLENKASGEVSDETAGDAATVPADTISSDAPSQ